MTPESFARVVVRNYLHNDRHPDVPFIAEAAGLPENVVSDIAADERRSQTPSRAIADHPQPASPGAVDDPPGQGGPAGCHITAIHDLRMPDGNTLVLIGCRCGHMLRAGIAEYPRHWNRHRAGLR